jgi:hypothetical protein
MEEQMKQHLLAKFLMLVCGLFVCAFSARSALAPPNPAGKLPPNMLKSIEEHTFGFTISPVTTNGGGFQQCQGLSGYLPGNQGNETAQNAYSINYCATASVTVVQKSIIDMTGKTLDLVVTSWHTSGWDSTSGGWRWSPIVDTYRLAFPSKNTLVFNKICFGSGLVDNSGQFSGKKDDAWITEHLKEQVGLVSASFFEARPLKLQVNYGGKSYAVANCAFQSSQSGATTVSCQGSPPAPVSAKGGTVFIPSPVVVGH